MKSLKTAAKFTIINLFSFSDLFDRVGIVFLGGKVWCLKVKEKSFEESGRGGNANIVSFIKVFKRRDK